MKRIFKLVFLPLITLASIGVSIATPGQAEALTCPAGQYAVRDTGGFSIGSDYANCRTPANPANDAQCNPPAIRSGIALPGIPPTCYPPAPANSVVIQCGDNETAVVIDGREHCRRTAPADRAGQGGATSASCNANQAWVQAEGSSVAGIRCVTRADSQLTQAPGGSENPGTGSSPSAPDPTDADAVWARDVCASFPPATRDANCEQNLRGAINTCRSRLSGSYNDFQPDADELRQCVQEETGIDHDILNAGNPGADDARAENLAQINSEAQCNASGGEWNANAPEGEQCSDPDPTCGTMATNIGWYMCPMIDAGMGFADAMWGFFEGLLIIDPLDDASPVYTVWSILRNLANVILTIIFLIVIFSQVSNVGISNYGIKKMLPKILIAAVLINTSFFLMQAAIDLSNSMTGILGALIRNAGADMTPPSFTGIWEGLIIALAAGGAIVGTTIAITTASLPGILLFIGLLLLPLIFGILSGTVTLLLRELLIPILAVFAPVAFALSLLPGTSKISSRWSSIFIGLLMFSVVTSIMYHGAILVLNIVIVDPDTNPFMRLVALAAISFLMIFLPFLAFKINPMTKAAFNGLRKGIDKMGGGWASGKVKGARDRAVKERVARNLAKPTLTKASRPGKDASRRARASHFLRRNLPGNRMRRAVNHAKTQELNTALYKAQSDQAYNETILKDPSMVERMESTPAGKKHLEGIIKGATESKRKQFENQTTVYKQTAYDKAYEEGDFITMNAIAAEEIENGGDPGPETLKEYMRGKNFEGKKGHQLFNSHMSYIANNHSGVMGKDLELKNILTNIAEPVQSGWETNADGSFKYEVGADGQPALDNQGNRKRIPKFALDSSGNIQTRTKVTTIDQAKTNMDAKIVSDMEKMTAQKFLSLSSSQQVKYAQHLPDQVRYDIENRNGVSAASVSPNLQAELDRLGSTQAPQASQQREYNTLVQDRDTAAAQLSDLRQQAQASPSPAMNETIRIFNEDLNRKSAAVQNHPQYQPPVNTQVSQTQQTPPTPNDPNRPPNR